MIIEQLRVTFSFFFFFYFLIRFVSYKREECLLESRLENYPCIVNTCLYQRSSLGQLFRGDRVGENVAIIYFYRWNGYLV